MNRLLDRIHAIGARAWLRFVQSLNAIAVAFLAGALVVHESYPTILGDLLAPLPAPAKAAALFGFGVVVHYALRRAAKAAAAAPPSNPTGGGNG